MSISAISNGENGLSVRQKLNSGISQLNQLNHPTDSTNKFSYVDPLYGSDSSGNGSFSNPYQTIGAAYSAGARNFFIQRGDAGVLDVSVGDTSTNFQIFGLGAMNFFPSSSSLDYPFSQTYDRSISDDSISSVTIVNNDATVSHMHINSNNGVVINVSGVASDALGAGLELACYNCILGNVLLNGKNGNDGANDNSSTPGENGGDGGILYLGYSTVVGDVSLIGGNGGIGGETFDGFGGGIGGDGGAGGAGDGSNGSNGADGSSFVFYSAYSMFSKAPIGTGAAPDMKFSMISGNIV